MNKSQENSLEKLRKEKTSEAEKFYQETGILPEDECLPSPIYSGEGLVVHDSDREVIWSRLSTSSTPFIVIP